MKEEYFLKDVQIYWDVHVVPVLSKHTDQEKCQQCVK